MPGNRTNRFDRRGRGVALIYVAVMMVVLIGLCSMAVDYLRMEQ